MVDLYRENIKNIIKGINIKEEKEVLLKIKRVMNIQDVIIIVNNLETYINVYIHSEIKIYKHY